MARLSQKYVITLRYLIFGPFRRRNTHRTRSASATVQRVLKTNKSVLLVSLVAFVWTGFRLSVGAWQVTLYCCCEQVTLPVFPPRRCVHYPHAPKRSPLCPTVLFSFGFSQQGNPFLLLVVKYLPKLVFRWEKSSNMEAEKWLHTFVTNGRISALYVPP